MMARNLDNRVELVAPVETRRPRAEIQTVLDLQLTDTALAWELGPDGSLAPGRCPEPGEEPLNSQEALMERAEPARLATPGRRRAIPDAAERAVRYRGDGADGADRRPRPGPLRPSRASTPRRPTSTSSATRPSASPSRRPARPSTSRSSSARGRSRRPSSTTSASPTTPDGLSYADLAVLLSQSK